MSKRTRDYLRYIIGASSNALVKAKETLGDKFYYACRYGSSSDGKNFGIKRSYIAESNIVSENGSLDIAINGLHIVNDDGSTNYISDFYISSNLGEKSGENDIFIFETEKGAKAFLTERAEEVFQNLKINLLVVPEEDLLPPMPIAETVDGCCVFMTSIAFYPGDKNENSTIKLIPPFPGSIINTNDEDEEPDLTAKITMSDGKVFYQSITDEEELVDLKFFANYYSAAKDYNECLDVALDQQLKRIRTTGQI